MNIPVEVIMKVNFTTVEIIEKAVITEDFLEEHCINSMLLEALSFIKRAEKFNGIPQSHCPDFHVPSSDRHKTVLVKFSIMFENYSNMMDYVHSIKP